ncbi:Peptidase family S49 [Pseudosulfitobacter pseudonitzschiae]|uniref:Peptidase S49 n=2 Tax=Pseudosulfitobacter pseudonitzschiae TaxID=1402135 RepID=A0A073J634_9RHOB|nr:S49 family peptidase [Pseudosulfitobacter pseudonitzschiae]KEJ97424.1 peptidase S49 [Pseudosulfitobacter pseudonitzschiae]QKS08715.1 S49 family peptidase [Pseudosulfitobacter pseudonitzschiae]SHE71396.1 Peptidase family S49 [Pseudosulfitobacter pseudonitzschiae]
MTRRTIGSYLQSSALALSHHGGDALLAMDVPADCQTTNAAAAVTVEPGERYAVARGVGVVPVRGLLTPNFFLFEKYMGWTTYQGLEQSLAELAANDDCSGIVLDMDCPGGMVLGIEGAAQAIAAAAAIKPVHVLVNPLAASAAYWLASQATEITITPGALVGSIGVRLTATSPQDTDNWGDQWFEISSSHARAKAPDPATEAGMAELRRSLDETEALFHAAVAAGRGIDPAQLTAQLSVTDDPQDGGAVFGPEQGIARGLVDQLENRDAFYARVMAAYAPAPRPQARAFAALAAAAQARAAT